MDSLGRGLNDAAQLASVLWRRRLVLGVVAALALAGQLALIVGLEKTFTASALIMLENPDEDLLASEGGSGSTDPFRVRSETDLMRSYAVAQRAAAEMGLVDWEEFAPKPQTWLRALLDADEEVLGAETAEAASEVRLRRVVEEYRDRIGISNDGRSLAVGIAASASTPELAAELANGHARAYLEIKSQELSNSLGSAQSSLQQAIARSAEALDAAERAAAEFLNSRPVLLRLGTSPTGSVLDDSLATLSSFVAEAERDIAETRATLDILETQGIFVPAAGMAQSPALDLMREAEARDLLELRSLTASSNDESGASSRAAQRLEATRAAISDEIDRLGTSLEAELAREEATLASLNDLIRAATVDRSDYNGALAEYRTRQVEAESRRAMHEALLQREAALQLAGRTLGMMATLASPATPPLFPSAPKTTLLALVAGVVSLGLGTFAALAAERLGRRTLPVSQSPRA